MYNIILLCTVKGARRERERERDRERGRGEREREGEGEGRDSAYPYLDKLSSGSTEPVPVRTEDQSIDDLSSIPSIQMLPLIQIP